MTEEEQDELDEQVHEAKASEAADINNSGEEAQRAYLAGFASWLTLERPGLADEIAECMEELTT